MEKVELELRTCIGDGRPFRVMKKSGQEFCSIRCEFHHNSIPREKWADRKSQKPEEERQQESNLESSMPILSGGQKSSNMTDKEEQKMSSGRESYLEPGIMETGNQETNVVSNGHETIERNKMNPTEIAMLPTKSEGRELSTRDVSAAILPGDSIINSMNLNGEISRSINSLNSVESELIDSMKGLRSSQPEPATRLYDPERVQTAVLCGRQIVENMKAKIELIKLAKQLGASN